MARRLSLILTIAALGLAACEQTVSLNDRGMDGGLKGTGGSSSGTGGGFGPMDASSGGGADGGHCSGSPPSITFTPDQQQVLIVLDRSTGMSETMFGPQDTELSAATFALESEVSYYTPINGSGRNGIKPSIIFSFLDFPDAGSDCGGSNMVCCAGNVTATTTTDAFVTATGICNSCIQTSTRPTAIALAKARVALSSNTPNTEKFVVLVTSGDPSNNCPLPNSTPGSSYCTDGIKTINDLAAEGVTTYIIGMGDQTNVNCLPSMGASTPSSSYSTASSESELMIDLTSIFGSNGGISQNACRLSLSQPVTSASQLSVSYNGSPVYQDHSNGWSITDGSGMRLKLNGSACTNFLKNESGGQSGLQILQQSCNSHGP